jgi:deazaflavin-dependent oxidoreductase (nitroreductase family)
MAGRIPPVDPERPRGRLSRAFYAFGMSAAGRWYGIHIASRIDPPLLRLTGGRFATTSVLPTLLLSVRGRRSGELRTVPLVYFTDGEDVILVASSFGRASNPAWYLNLVANPDVELTAGGVTAPYRAREATGAERDRLFALARANYEGYGSYQVLAGDRKIPVMALSPAGDDPTAGSARSG